MKKTRYSNAVIGLIAIFYTTCTLATPSPWGDIPQGPILSPLYGKIPILLNDNNGQERWRGSVKLFPNITNTSIGIVSIYEESGSFIISYNYKNLTGSCNWFSGGGITNPSKSGNLRFIIDDYVDAVGTNNVEISFTRNFRWSDDDKWHSVVYWGVIPPFPHVRTHNDGCADCIHTTGSFNGMCSTFHLP